MRTLPVSPCRLKPPGLPKPLAAFLIACLLILNTAPPQLALAKKKKLSKDEKAITKEVEPLQKTLNTLTVKVQSRGLFSVDDVTQLVDTSDKVLQLAKDYPNQPMVADWLYRTAQLLVKREQWEQAWTLLNEFSTQFADHPFVPRVKGQLAFVERQMGGAELGTTTTANAPAEKK